MHICVTLLPCHPHQLTKSPKFSEAVIEDRTFYESQGN